MISQLVYNWEFWVILGLTLIALEALEGSFNFFLPSSIGSILTALFVYILPEISWKLILLIFAVSSFIAFASIKRYGPKNNQKDINDY